MYETPAINCHSAYLLYVTRYSCLLARTTRVGITPCLEEGPVLGPILVDRFWGQNAQRPWKITEKRRKFLRSSHMADRLCMLLFGLQASLGEARLREARPQISQRMQGLLSSS